MYLHTQLRPDKRGQITERPNCKSAVTPDHLMADWMILSISGVTPKSNDTLAKCTKSKMVITGRKSNIISLHISVPLLLCSYYSSTERLWLSSYAVHGCKNMWHIYVARILSSTLEHFECNPYTQWNNVWFVPTTAAQGNCDSLDVKYLPCWRADTPGVGPVLKVLPWVPPNRTGVFDLCIVQAAILG